VAVVVWRGKEAIRQKGRLVGRAFVAHLLGGLQNIGKGKDFSDIEKREEPGGSKSHRPIERGGGNRKDIRRPSHGL
jgi:hypothetical protein